jgi:hypothetical protein
MAEESTDQVLGIVLFAAISPDYTIRSIVFTDKEVFQIPLSQMSELATRLSGLPVTAAWLLEAANPAVFSGLGGLVGLRMWSNLKKKVAEIPPVKVERGPLPPGLIEAAKSRLPYTEIKQVKISKVMMSSDYLLKLTAGFLKTQMIVFEERAVQYVTSLVGGTPLALKM